MKRMLLALFAMIAASTMSNCTTTTRIVEIAPKPQTSTSHVSPKPKSTKPAEFKALMQYD